MIEAMIDYLLRFLKSFARELLDMPFACKRFGLHSYRCFELFASYDKFLTMLIVCMMYATITELGIKS